MQGTNVPKQPTIPAMPNKREMGGKGMSQKYIIASDDLTPYIADEAYAEGYTLAESKYREARHEMGQEAYQRGLNDAWWAARKIGCMVKDGGLNNDDLTNLFASYATHVILRDYGAIEAIKKIREYEERKAQEAEEIKVGDEVCSTLFCHQKIKGIAVGQEIDGAWNVLDEKGSLMSVDTTYLTKTGRHVDLSVLFGDE